MTFACKVVSLMVPSIFFCFAVSSLGRVWHCPACGGYYEVCGAYESWKMGRERMLEDIITINKEADFYEMQLNN